MGAQDADFIIVTEDNVAIERDTLSIKKLICGIPVHRKMHEVTLTKAVNLSPDNGHALASDSMSYRMVVT